MALMMFWSFFHCSHFQGLVFCLSSLQSFFMSSNIADTLKPYREKIDSLDDQLVDLLIAREKIIREVADVKLENNIPAVLQDRVDEVRDRCVARAVDAGMDGDYVREIYTKIITLSCNIEEEKMTADKESN